MLSPNRQWTCPANNCDDGKSWTESGAVGAGIPSLHQGQQCTTLLWRNSVLKTVGHNPDGVSQINYIFEISNNNYKEFFENVANLKYIYLKTTVTNRKQQLQKMFGKTQFSIFCLSVFHLKA
jgi:hypothetical protein